MVLVNKGELEAGLKTAGKIITNKRIAFLDDNYLSLVRYQDGLYLAARGDKHTIVEKLVSGLDEDNKELHINYAKIVTPLSELEDSLGLYLQEDQLNVVSGRAKLHFQGYESEPIAGLIEEADALVERVKSEGVSIERKEFLEVLTYLHSLRDKDATMDTLQDIYFTKSNAFVAGTRFGVRMDYKVPYDFGISIDASDTLITFLDGKQDVNLYFLVENETGEPVITFVAGDSYYRVEGITTTIFTDVLERFDSFRHDVELTLSKHEFIRYVKLATFFTQDDEDIIVKVVGDQGIVQSDAVGGEQNSSKGEFTVHEDVEDFEIAMNGDDIKLIFDGLGTAVDDEIKLLINLNVDVEAAYFKHSKGDCILSIRNLEF